MFAKIVVLLLCALSQLWTCLAAHVPDLTIIRGVNAQPHELPSMVYLVLNLSTGKTEGCSGSLIHPQFVMTAAHCLDDIGTIEARLGCHLRDCSDKDQAIEHTTFAKHPSYTGVGRDHDIGIVKLSKAATVKPGVVEVIRMVDPAKMPSRNGYYNDRNATTYGWGRMEGGFWPRVLQKLEGRTGVSLDSNYTVWLGRKDGKPGIACHGDSGSPLLWNNLQIGVLSGGIAPCEESMFTIFSRVDYNREWIDSYIRTN